MDGPSLEIDPSKFIIALGPQFTAIALRRSFAGDEDSAIRSAPPSIKLPALDVKGMVDQGIAILLESRGQFQSEAELSQYEQLYRDALEVDPLAKLSLSMHQCGRYAEWLERCFKLDAIPERPCAALAHIPKLLEMGSLLVYTGCDDVLSKLTNLPVLIPQDKDSILQWWRGAKRGIMHVHGVYWKPESLQLNCEAYTDPNHPVLPAMEQLGHIFKERYVVSLGMCESHLQDNPMMAKFAGSFLRAARYGQCFNLTMLNDRREMSPEYADLLHLPLLESQSGQPLPELAFSPLSDTSRVLCKCLMSACNNVSIVNLSVVLMVMSW